MRRIFRRWPQRPAIITRTPHTFVAHLAQSLRGPECGHCLGFERALLPELFSDYHTETGVPYVGMVYDLNDNFSAYASYTEIFIPQQLRPDRRKYFTCKGFYRSSYYGDPRNVMVSTRWDF